MNQQEFREWVADAISSQARLNGQLGFSLQLSYDEYLMSARRILEQLSQEVGPYSSSYDFNLKKASFFPEKTT